MEKLWSIQLYGTGRMFQLLLGTKCCVILIIFYVQKNGRRKNTKNNFLFNDLYKH